MSEDKDTPRYILNTEFKPEGAEVVLALLNPELQSWFHAVIDPDGNGMQEHVDVPTLRLTPAEAIELCKEIMHYTDVAVNGIPGMGEDE